MNSTYTAPASVTKAMTIAGSDSGGGAGIQADLKTFAAFGVYGTSVLAAVTAQSTRGVFAIAEVPEEVVIAQLDVVLEDIGTDAAKTGMLSNPIIVENVADRLEAWGVEKLVVDPVMVAKGGARLLQPEAISALTKFLLPLSKIVTPNIPEAEVLAGRSILTDDNAREAARAIASYGPKFVVIKGGHRDGPPVDLVFDGRDFIEFEGERVDTNNTHGTGCTFSAAITALLSLGLAPLDAIAEAKAFVTDALRASYAIGDGHSPVNHLVGLQTRQLSRDSSLAESTTAKGHVNAVS